MVADPPALPVTRPLVFTVAIVELLLDHVTTRPTSTFPAESLVVAANCVVPFTCKLTLVGETETVATGTGTTVIVEVLLFPSLVAVTTVEPKATAVTNPLELTVPTAELLLVQVIFVLLNVPPAESKVIAVSWRTAPTKRLAATGLTVMEATGTIETVIVATPLFPSLVA